MPVTLTPPKTNAKNPPRLMTAEEFFDFCNLPENEERSFELVRGEVIEMSRPTVRHGAVAVKVAAKLDNYCEANPIGIVVGNDSGVILERLPDTVRGPDVAIYAGVARQEDLPKKWSDKPPILAVEVRSPNDSNRTLTRKIADYLSNGIKEVWVLDYEEQFLTVHRLAVPAKDYGIEEDITSELLPGFCCKVGSFFGIASPPS